MTVRLYGRVTRGLGWSAPVRGNRLFILLILLYAICCPDHVKGQTPNLIVEVRLDGTGQATTVEAEFAPHEIKTFVLRDGSAVETDLLEW